MKYLSTRGGEAVTAAQAIVQGISPTGGLYVPSSFPQLDIKSLNTDYLDTAYAILSKYLPETDGEELRQMLKDAYRSFDDPAVTPVVPLTETESVL